MRQEAIQQEALTRAVTGQSMSNYPAIVQGFMDKGIPADQITPRVNVFSFHAWKALGRRVKKGEHGVKVLTYITTTRKADKEGEEDQVSRRPWTTTVFHVSQTEPQPGFAASMPKPETLARQFDNQAPCFQNPEIGRAHV